MSSSEANELQLVVPEMWSVAKTDAVSDLRDVERIETDDDYEFASAAISSGKRIRKELEAQRKSVTSKLDTVKKAIMAEEKRLSADLDAEIERVSGIASAWATAQMEKRRAEEERIAREKAEAAEAAVAAEDDDPFGITSASTTQDVEVLPATDRPRNVAMLTRIELVDEAKVPRQFLSFDDRKVSAFVKYQKSLGVRVQDIVVPGVRITEVASLRSR